MVCGQWAAGRVTESDAGEYIIARQRMDLQRRQPLKRGGSALGGHTAVVGAQKRVEAIRHRRGRRRGGVGTMVGHEPRVEGAGPWEPSRLRRRATGRGCRRQGCRERALGGPGTERRVWVVVRVE